MEDDSLWMKIVVFVGVRAIWHVGLMLVAVFGVERYYYGHWIDLFDKTYFLAILYRLCTVGVFCRSSSSAIGSATGAC